jgi:hypothetical protein
MESINKFIEQLLKDKKLPQLDEAVHRQLVNDLSTRLVDVINRRLLEAMPEKDMEAFTDLLDQKPVEPEKVQAFIDAKVSDKQQITLDAMIEFRARYLGANA